jgi:hypothetical protein
LHPKPEEPEIVAADTGEVERSRQRCATDAYRGTRHREM